MEAAMEVAMITEAVAAQPLLLDEVLPTFQFTRLETIAVCADPAAVYAAARDLDLLSIHSPLFDVVDQARGLADRVLHRPAPRLPSIRVADLFDAGAGAGAEQPWVGLGETPGRELVIGAVGRVRRPSMEWLPVSSAAFTAFAVPGWAKIAAAFVVHPYSEHRALVTYEVRTAGTDPEAAARFARYRALLSPGAGLVLRQTLRAVRATAEGRPGPRHRQGRR
jgi:hypothetical protein